MDITSAIVKKAGTHSRLEPIKKAAKTFKVHLDNIVTYARHRITNPLTEGINAKIEKVKRLSCGFWKRLHYRTRANAYAT